MKKIFIILTITMLLEVNVVAQEKIDVLINAIYDNNYTLFKEIVDSGIDLEKRDKSFGFTPLLAATSKQNKEMVLYLLEKGANVNAKSRSGGTPLKIAARGNNPEILKIIIKNGADLKEWYPIFLAISHNKIKNVEILLDAGVDVNIMDPNGYTPLSCAAASCNVEITKLVLKYRPDVNAGVEGRTALYFVRFNKAENGEIEPRYYKAYEIIEKLLIKAGAKEVDISKIKRREE